jgi:AraC family transcriptional regulator of adaptative response/methylated-DNA-[protein]-cysteine methyltransferase
VQQRDRRADGTFVYAVSTTRIYCRPTCPSRRPRRENVAFYATPGDAERAGYRPCRRCRPDTAGVRDDGAHHAERARAFIDHRLAAAPSEPVTLTAIAGAVGLSPYHLQRTFKRAIGITPAEYVRAQRGERLRSALRSGDTVSAAVYGAGYGSASRVYDDDAPGLGMTPGAYRRGGSGVRMRYVILDSPLGRLLVAATARGVCAVTLGDADEPLERALADEYPNAQRERVAPEAVSHAGTAADDALAAWAAAIRTHLGQGGELRVPIDVGGTAFQRRVWAALQAIPYGETRSYGELATAVSAPTAVRAAASACARNPVALVVPCHRVLRSGGALGGYRWGVERKQRLLEAERRLR